MHHAHLPLQHCLELAASLRDSGAYGHVNIENRVCYQGEYFAQVYVEPKSAAHDESSLWVSLQPSTQATRWV